MRKDNECLFVVLQRQFNILRREIESWNFEDVVLVSEVCVILHNHLIHVRQSSAFGEEINEKDASFNTIGQFMDEDKT